MNRTKIEEMLKELELEQLKRDEVGFDYFSERSTELRGMIAVLTSLLHSEDGEGWISVEESLPKTSGIYWCYIYWRDKLMGEDTYRQMAISFTNGIWSTLHGERVTHWMPLPPAPSKGEAK